MKHKIISYRQDELFTTREEYTYTAENDADAMITVQELRKQGHTISGWLQDATQTVQGRKGKEARS
jgi:hypothetical protein